MSKLIQELLSLNEGQDGDNTEAFFDAITKATGFDAEVQDSEEDMGEAYIVGGEGGNELSTDYRVIIFGENLDGQGEAKITRVTIDPYPYGDGRPTKVNVNVTFNGGDEKSLEKAAADVWSKIGTSIT